MMMVQALSTESHINVSRELQYLSSLVTTREKEVLKYMSRGYTSSAIAELLFLSEHTIISHRKNLMIKLDARNSAHLVMKGVQLGLLNEG